MTSEELIEKIRKVEALYMNGATEGERQAAAAAMDRLRLKLDEAPEPTTEWQFSLPDPWKRQLFLAVARRLGLKPYRLPRQKYSTVMIRCTNSMVDEILWPQYTKLSALLHDYLAETTKDIITRSVHGDISEAPEQAVLPL